MNCKGNEMIIYIHGFNSSGQSGKAQELADIFPDEKIIAPDLPWQPEKAMALLEQLIDRHREEQILLIGSSLGGFYAQYLGWRFGCPVVLINPALDPVPLLLEYVGEQTNYYTHEVYHLPEEAVYSLRRFAVAPREVKSPVLVLLDKGDEVIDYRIAEQAYRDYGIVKCFEGGSHRFDHLQDAKAFLQSFHSDAIKIGA